MCSGQTGGGPTTTAALIALNNTVCSEDEREAVRSHLKASSLFDPVCSRLQWCISWGELPLRVQNAARNLLQRLQKRDRQGGNPLQYTLLCAPLLAPPPQDVVPMPM